MSLSDRIRLHMGTIRKGSDAFLIDTCTIVRKVGETVVQGQAIPEYETETVACRPIIRSGTAQTNIASQQRAIGSETYVGIYKFHLPRGTVIREDDNIEYTDLYTGLVNTYKVTYVPSQNEYTGAFIVIVEEVV
jgi:hypothetical protein